MGFGSHLSRECYVKCDTIHCIVCKNNFLKTNAGSRCSSCYDLIKNKLEK